MTNKPYRLSTTERVYIITGEATGSYQKSELKNRVQDRLDNTEDRISSLERDITTASHFTDFEIPCQYSPYELGEKMGKIANHIISFEDHDGVVEPASEFLSGVIVGIARSKAHSEKTPKSRSEFVEEVIQQAANTSRKEIQHRAGTREKVHIDDLDLLMKQKEEERGYIREVLNENELEPNDWVIDIIRKNLAHDISPEAVPERPHFDEWNAFESVSESDIIEIVENQRLADILQKKKQFDSDMDRLLTDRRGIYPYEVFKAVAMSDTNGRVHTSDITDQWGMDAVVTTILNDLAGKERQRKSNPDQIWSDKPLIQKDEKNNQLTLTEHGENMSSYLFEGGHDIFDMWLAEYYQRLSKLGLQP